MQTTSRSPTNLASRPHSVPVVHQVISGLSTAAKKYEAPVEQVRAVLGDVLGYMRAGYSVHAPISNRFQAEVWERLTPGAKHWGVIKAVASGLTQEAPDRAATMLLVGMMLDAFPTAGREPRDGYYATLVHEIGVDTYGPSVVAVACRDLRRSARFLPTVQEVLEACEKVRDGINRSAATIDLALARQLEADALLSAPAAPTIIQGDHT